MSDLSLCLLPSPWTGRGRPIALAGSIVLHIAILPAALSYAAEAGRTGPPQSTHYRIEILHLQATLRQSAKISNSRRMSIQLPLLKLRAQQTLVIPDAPPELALKQSIPAPPALSWDALEPPPDGPVRVDEPKPIPVQNIAASLSLSRPNNEPHVADLKIASATPNPLLPSLPVFAGTTTPLRIEGAKTGDQMPEMAQPQVNDLPKADIISSPYAALRAKDTVIVAKVSQLAASEPKGASQATVGSSSGIKNEALQSQPESTLGLTRIDLPPDGKFSVSVLGASVADEYPDSADLMRGRVVSTVYLNVGLKKSWILEYSASAPQQAGETGNTAAPEAPWPFLMMRPAVSIPPEADAILVHSVLTIEGKFDELAVVLPSEWAQKDTLLNALRQWRFRPATKNGQPVEVEVLLIIPRPPEEE